MSTIHSLAGAQAQEHLYAIRRAARAGRAVAAMMANAQDGAQPMECVSAHDMGALVELLSEQVIAGLDGMDAIRDAYSQAAA